MRPIPTRLLGLSVVVMVAVGGCGSGSERPTVPPPTAPSPAPSGTPSAGPLQDLEPGRAPGAMLRAPAVATGDPELDPLVSYLKASYSKAIKDGRRLIIEDTTDVEHLHFREPYQELADKLLRQASEEVPAQLIRDFIEKNRESRAVWPELTRHLPASLLPLAEEKAIFFDSANAGWDRFYAKYPKAYGIITVSRVGLNRDKTLAFFYVGEGQAPVLGLGQIHVLKKEGDEWVELPVEIRPFWIA